MPSPVSNNSSVYDPSLDVCRTEDCDAGSALCASSAHGDKQAAPAILLDASRVEGDLGVRSLLKQHDEKLPDCSTEQKAAVLSCLTAGAAVLAGVASASTVVGTVGGMTTAFVAGVSCGKDLRALQSCKDGS